MTTKTTTPLYDSDYYHELYAFLEKYDDYYIPEAIEIDETVSDTKVDTIELVTLILTIIFGILAFVIFLTVLSEKVRSTSASWYVYSLAVETVIQSLVFTPTTVSRSFGEGVYVICRVLDTRLSFSLLRVTHLILINMEVAFTILMPMKFWLTTASRRFIIMLVSTWILAFVFSDMILPSLQDSHCFARKEVARIAVLVVLNWVPGLVVLLLTVACVVFYSKGFFLRHVLSESPGCQLQQRVRAHEWFIFIIILNAQFLLLDLVFQELLNKFIDDHNFSHMMAAICLHIVHEVVRLGLPLTLLAISPVRQGLFEVLKRTCSVRAACQERKTEQDEEALTMSGSVDQAV